MAVALWSWPIIIFPPVKYHKLEISLLVFQKFLFNYINEQLLILWYGNMSKERTQLKGGNAYYEQQQQQNGVIYDKESKMGPGSH